MDSFDMFLDTFMNDELWDRKTQGTITHECELDDKLRYLYEHLSRPLGDYTVSTEIANKLIASKYDENSISLLIKEMIEHLQLPYQIISVIVRMDNKASSELKGETISAAGKYIHTQVFHVIEVNLRKHYDFNRVVAIVCHEITHHYLFSKKVFLKETSENELLTDIGAIYLGFGNYLLRGYQPYENREITAGGERMHCEHLGYISPWQISYVMKRIVIARKAFTKLDDDLKKRLELDKQQQESRRSNQYYYLLNLAEEAEKLLKTNKDLLSQLLKKDKKFNQEIWGIVKGNIELYGVIEKTIDICKHIPQTASVSAISDGLKKINELHSKIFSYNCIYEEALNEDAHPTDTGEEAKRQYDEDIEYSAFVAASNRIYNYCNDCSKELDFLNNSTNTSLRTRSEKGIRLFSNFNKDTSLDFQTVSKYPEKNKKIKNTYGLVIVKFLEIFVEAEDYSQAEKLTKQCEYLLEINISDMKYQKFLLLKQEVIERINEERKKETKKEKNDKTEEQKKRREAFAQKKGYKFNFTELLGKKSGDFKGDGKIYGRIAFVVLIIIAIILSVHFTSRNGQPISRPAATTIKTNKSSKSSSHGRPKLVITGYAKNEPFLNNTGLCKLTIDNTKNDEAVFVRLWNNNKPVRAFFIMQQESFTLKNLNSGTYEIRYKTLYENPEDEVASKSEPFELKQTTTSDGVRYSNDRITLYKVTNGNFHTNAIDVKDI